MSDDEFEGCCKRITRGKEIKSTIASIEREIDLVKTSANFYITDVNGVTCVGNPMELRGSLVVHGSRINRSQIADYIVYLLEEQMSKLKKEFEAL